MSTLLLMLFACGDALVAAQSEGTPEALQAWIDANPTDRRIHIARDALEGVVLKQARDAQTLAAYDTYLERFPKGKHRQTAWSEREALAFAEASTLGTVQAWDSFLEAYPRADKQRLEAAQRMRAVADYAEHLQVGEVRVHQVNMAEDPKGPLDGWGFEAQVTNSGPRTVTELRLTVSLLDDQGQVLAEREWPVVAPRWPIPIEEERKQPMRTGQTRTWLWTDGAVPDAWASGARRATVRPTRVAFAP